MRIRNFIALIAAISVIFTVDVDGVTTWTYTSQFATPDPPSNVNNIDCPDRPSPWSTPITNYYYVMPTHKSATDTGNTYGSATTPRLTVPTGSPIIGPAYIYINGTYSKFHNGYGDINGNNRTDIRIGGTPGNYVCIDLSDATVTNQFDIGGAFFFIEGGASYNGQDFDSNTSGGGCCKFAITSPTYGAVLHRVTIQGDLSGGGCTLINAGRGGRIQYVIYDDVRIHDNGNPSRLIGESQDRHGCSIGNGIDHVWWVRSQFYNNEGDAIQCNAGPGNQFNTSHMYFSGNIGHGNKQSSGAWFKYCSDSIVSDNDLYDAATVVDSSGLGQGTGAQYQPDNIWWIRNRITDVDRCFSTGTFDTEDVARLFFVGNICYDTHPYSETPSANSFAAFGLWGGNPRVLMNNTVYNVTSGVAIPSAGTLYMFNEAYHTVASNGFHVWIEGGSIATSGYLVSSSVFGPTLKTRINGSTQPPVSPPGTLPNIVSADFKFVNDAAHDFRIADNTSPLINPNNAYNPSQIYEFFYSEFGVRIDKDCVGNDRFVGLLDAGACEFGTYIPPPPPDPIEGPFKNLNFFRRLSRGR